MIPDHNHDGKTDKYDREMEKFLRQESEKIWQGDSDGSSSRAESWVFLVVVGIMIIGFFVVGGWFGIH